MCYAFFWYVLLTNSRGNHMEMFLFKLYCYLSRNRFTSPIKDLLSKIACPLNAEEHFWHDGCPVCHQTEVCPGCNIRYVAWDDCYYGGCCSPECHSHMMNTFG